MGPNKQHFVTSHANATWYGVGENLGWMSNTTDWRSSVSSAAAWLPYLTNLSAVGANYARVWLTDAWDDLMVETELGNYSLTNSANIDFVLEQAERRGIKLMMSIESFNLFQNKSGARGGWVANVYNKANGGPIDKPAQFFTDPTAKAIFKRRLRYLASRYGSSTSVFSWELFNEVDVTDGLQR